MGHAFVQGLGCLHNAGIVVSGVHSTIHYYYSYLPTSPPATDGPCDCHKQGLDIINCFEPNNL